MLRSAMLGELRESLWSYLSTRAVATDIESAGAGVLGLHPDEAARVLSARIALSDEALELVAHAPELVRTLRAASATRSLVAHGRVEGRVDWQRTQIHRLRHAGDPTLFVTSPSHRMYDTRRARALKFALEALVERIRTADVGMAADVAEARDAIHDSKSQLGDMLAQRGLAALRSLENPKLGGVRSLPVAPESLSSGSYASEGWDAVVNFLELIAAVESATDPLAAANMVSRVLWAPASDGALFEWLVGFRLIAGYRALGYQPTHVSALSARKEVPFADLAGPRGSVRIFRQSAIATASRYAYTKTAHGLDGRRLRPDFRIEHSWQDTDVVVEAKHTTGTGTSPINTALAESLAYIYDVKPYFDDAAPPVAIAVSSDKEGLAPKATEVALCGPDQLAAVVALLVSRGEARVDYVWSRPGP